LIDALPDELGELAPLLALTLGEHQDASMSGLVKMLERSLSDPRRLRSLLRFQSAMLTHWGMTGEPGKFSFEPIVALPPMFQAFPLQVSVAALLLDGVRHSRPVLDLEEWGQLVFVRQTVKGGNADRTGLSNAALRLHTSLDGAHSLKDVARQAGCDLTDLVVMIRGLEMAGLVERRNQSSADAILVLDDDPDTVRIVQRGLGPGGTNHQLKLVRDRVAAQLLLRRQVFNLMILAIDRPEQEAFFRACKQQNSAGTRFIGIASIEDESELARLDAMGLDGVLHRPLSEADLLATVKHLLARDREASAVVA
jgi:CheY-like chemotaxis protein